MGYSCLALKVWLIKNKNYLINKNLRHVGIYWLCQFLLIFKLKFEQISYITCFNIKNILIFKDISFNRVNKVFKNLFNFKKLKNIRSKI